PHGWLLGERSDSVPANIYEGKSANSAYQMHRAGPLKHNKNHALTSKTRRNYRSARRQTVLTRQLGMFFVFLRKSLKGCEERLRPATYVGYGFLHVSEASTPLLAGDPDYFAVGARNASPRFVFVVPCSLGFGD